MSLLHHSMTEQLSGAYQPTLEFSARQFTFHRRPFCDSAIHAAAIEQRPCAVTRFPTHLPKHKLAIIHAYSSPRFQIINKTVIILSPVLM